MIFTAPTSTSTADGGGTSSSSIGGRGNIEKASAANHSAEDGGKETDEIVGGHLAVLRYVQHCNLQCLLMLFCTVLYCAVI